MKLNSNEIVEKLKKEGYKLGYGTYNYWNNVPYVEHQDGRKTWIAKTYVSMGMAGIERNFEYEIVKKAISEKAYDIKEYEEMEKEKKMWKEIEKLD